MKLFLTKFALLHKLVTKFVVSSILFLGLILRLLKKIFDQGFSASHEFLFSIELFIRAFGHLNSNMDSSTRSFQGSLKPKTVSANSLAHRFFTASSHFGSLFLVLFVCFAGALNAQAPSSFPDDNVNIRIANLDIPFVPFYDQGVHYVISRYLANPASFERLMGRGATYFPHFEKALLKYNLPPQLKYLPIVESGLNAGATSSAAARGLWQFMPATGARYGLLRQNGEDELRDPIKASDAAARYLRDLYSMFGKWDLVLAAYNCGEGRVQRVIATVKTDDYLALRAYLPKETQGYVPAFIAVTYLMQHTQQHQLKPQLPELDMQMIVALNVFKPINFWDIQQATGLNAQQVAALNPHLYSKAVPATQEGVYVYVPRRVAAPLISFLNTVETTQSTLGTTSLSLNTPVEPYSKSTYLVRDGDMMEQLAQAFNVSPFTLMAWNDLHSPYLTKNQEIQIFVPNGNDIPGDYVVETSSAGAVRHYILPDGEMRTILPDEIENNDTSTGAIAKNNAKVKKATAPVKKAPVQKFKSIKVKSGDTLSELAGKYKVEIADIRKANKMGKSSTIRPGQSLKIPLKK